MTKLPSEIQNYSKEVVGITKPDHPYYYSWVFDPVEGVAHISDDHGRPRRHKQHHIELSKKVNNHPERVHGYAYRIRNGWVITDVEHQSIDPFIKKSVVESIKEKEK